MNENIKTGLENLPQVPPPDMVWENIERRLDEGKRRRMPVWLFYTVSSAASLAILAAAWILFSRIENDTTTVVTNPPAAEKNNAAPADSNKSVKENKAEAEGKIVAQRKEELKKNDKSVVYKQNSDTSKILTMVPVLVIGSNSTETHQITPDVTSFSPPQTLYLSAPSFTAQSYKWDLGGVNATAPINHYYTQSGTYNVIMTDENGNAVTDFAGSDDYEEIKQPLSQEDMNDYNSFRGNVFAKDKEEENHFVQKVQVVGKKNQGLIQGEQSLSGVADTLSEGKYYTEPESFESYAPLIENEYQNPFKAPLSTFSIDVDNASYSNTRRMIQSGQKPPKDAVRIEEFVNYFDYAYTQPKGDVPFSIHLETASSPWNKDTRVVAIGLKGLDIDRKSLPASNLVFLIDVSGSMEEENKLPLVKKSLQLLVDQMRPQDRIALVTYAGAAGLVLKSTACSEKELIKEAIDNLDAGGSTAGGEGIVLAYKVAGENLKKDGNNRIILVTDGDFNVGLQSDGEMESLIEEKRKEGIALTVCGFGMGNYKDSKMEILADKGNGNYYYIDNYKESKKVFEKGLTGTLFTIAKDVKIQVEFNPKFVKAYRLIGYENRQMPPQDFDNDAKDAGELGAGHTVTALYEIIPVGSPLLPEGFIELKYQQKETATRLKDYGDELLTAKLRYKKPGEETSRLLEQTLQNNNQLYENASDNLRYACGVTAFAMLLRESKFKGEATYGLARELVESTQLNIENGYREELLQLITTAEGLSQ